MVRLISTSCLLRISSSLMPMKVRSPRSLTRMRAVPGSSLAMLYLLRPISCRNSTRVVLESRNAPSITEVFMVEFCFSTPRIIMHMGLADERQQVMFAQRVQLDVLDDHHLVVVGGEQCAVDDFLDALRIAMTQVLHGLGCAFWGIQQTFAVRVFSQANKNLTVMLWQR